MQAGFLARRSVAVIQALSGSRIDEFYELSIFRLGNSLFFLINSRFEGFDAGSYAAFDRTIMRPSLFVLSMPLCGII
jgi:hypothetical protein